MMDPDALDSEARAHRESADGLEEAADTEREAEERADEARNETKA